MIFEAMELVRAELQAYLQAHGDQVEVELGSIATSKSAEGGRVVVTLVNVEEEAALKNSTAYQRNPTGGIDLVNPPVFLNLYLLVAATFQETGYNDALRRLSRVVQCFQRKIELSMASTPSAKFSSASTEEAARVRISLDLCTMSFEKMGQLWGTLGGQQVPCVLYKVRVVEEQDATVTGASPEITSIERRFASVAPTN